jgi:hypothetical protein
VRCSDERLPLDRRGNFRRLADRLEQKLADFAQVQIRVAVDRRQRGLGRRAVLLTIMGIMMVALTIARVSGNIDPMMVMVLTLRN